MPGRIAGQIAPKGIIAGSTRSLRGNADDAEVVPPALCGRSDWLYARMDRTQGHNRGINPLATWKYGRRGGRPSRAMRS